MCSHYRYVKQVKLTWKQRPPAGRTGAGIEIRRVAAHGLRTAVLAFLMFQIIYPSKAEATSAPLMVFFEHDSAALNTKALHLLVFAAQARSQMEAAISLSGHTDATGSTEYNRALGLKRAAAVKEALVRLGAPGSYIRVETHGEAWPLRETPDDVKEAINRRVEFVFGPLDENE